MEKGEFKEIKEKRVSILQMYRLNKWRIDNDKRGKVVSILQMYRLNAEILRSIEIINNVSILQMYRLNSFKSFLFAL